MIDADEYRGEVLRGLIRLQDAWLERHRAKALGGKIALGGFHYQFEITLLAAVEAWIDLSPGERRSPALFAERLSDISMVDSDGVCAITEVKKTLTKESLESALEGFQLIDELASEVVPAALPVAYRVSCRKGDLDMATTWLGRWVEADPASRRRLSERVRVVLEPRPRETILALLANEIGAPAPAETFQEGLSPLFDAARNGDFQRAIESIWAALVAAERATRAPEAAYLWTDEDRPPPQVVRGPILTGKQPLVIQLRDGCFAPRPDLSHRLLPEVLRRLEEQVRAPSSKLSIIWLAAPPGAGKSVALLQVLAEIHQQRSHQVLYAANAPAGLAATIEWATSLGDGDLPPLIAIDDPYPPEHRKAVASTWRDVVAHLSGSRHGGAFDQLPLLIAAGTSEQARRLADDFADEIEVSSLALAPETEKSLRALAGWYEQRTGRQVEEPLDPTQPLVHSVFEWVAGADLSEFASRLRRQLLDLSPDGAALRAAQRLLLANQVGLGLPEKSLRQRLSREALEGIRPLLFHEAWPPEPDATEELWFAHRRVAAHIVDLWFGKGGEAEVEDRFAEAMADITRYGATDSKRAAPVLLLADSSRTDYGRGPKEDLALAARLYPIALKQGRRRQIPARQMPAWLALRAAGAKLEEPEPIDLALEHLVPQNLDRSDLPSLILGLLRTTKVMTENQKSDARELVVRLLETDRRWLGWWAVAIALAQNLPDPRLPGLVSLWAGKRRTRTAAQALFAVDQALPGDAAVGSTAGLILADRGHEGWPYAWSILWKRGRSLELANRAMIWMRQVGSDPSFGWVWMTLWDEQDLLEETIRKELVKCGLGFLEMELVDVGWARIWSTLWEEEPRLRLPLRKLGHDWVGRARSSSQGFSYVWSELWTIALKQGDDKRAEALEKDGYGWLEVAQDKKGWAAVFSPLIKHAEKKGVDELGFAWLESASAEHHDWVRVWETLWASADSEEKEWLTGKGREWLDIAPDWHLGRPRVVEELWKESEDPSLRRSTCEWLDSTDERHPVWGWLWLALDDGLTADQRRRGKQFCRRAMDNPAWQRVWSLLWRAQEEVEMIDLAQKWLRRKPFTERGRIFIVRVLREDGPAQRHPEAAPQLRTIDREAVDWAYAWDRWGEEGDQIWQLLFEERPELRDDLVVSGRHWLQHEEIGARGWLNVWTRMLAHLPEDTALLDVFAEKVEGLDGEQPFRLREALPPLLGLEKENAETTELLKAMLGDEAAQLEPVGQKRLEALQALLKPGKNGAGASPRVRGEAVAWLVGRVDPAALPDLLDELLAWLDANPGGGIALGEAAKALARGEDRREDAARFYAALQQRLQGHPDEDELRTAEVKLVESFGGEPEVDEVLRAALVRLTEMERPSLELAGATLACAGRVGSAETVKEVLRWTVRYLDLKSPERSDETLVKAFNGAYLRLAQAGRSRDVPFLAEAKRVFEKWKDAFPTAPLPALGTPSRRQRLWLRWSQVKKARWT